MFRPPKINAVTPDVLARASASQRRVYTWVAAVAVFVVLIWPARVWYIHYERGHADPGGKRLGFLAGVAEQAIPPAATDERLHLIKSKWSPGGCDGGPAGWSQLEVDQQFRTVGDSIAQIDAAMIRQHWRPLPSKGGPDVREYKSTSSTYVSYGWLSASRDGSGTTWELDLEADPAEHPAASC